MSKGFTLIELLIVVAIIAILAAIAVPNFLEAQTRAKVSRAKNDLRVCATALESYMVDNNKYPYEQLAEEFPHRLTTSIAYLSTSLVDVFRATAPDSQSLPYSNRTFWYFRLMTPEEESRPDVLAFRGSDGDYESDQATLERFGPWAMSSYGPDQIRDNAWQPVFSEPSQRFYDATNGTISTGDIVRTQTQSATNTN
jgi:prepilin-type N-terminal cleavage/methylation domain-containing protein